MIRFDLIYESNDPQESEALAEAVRAVVSDGTLILRSAGTDARHRVVIAFVDLDERQFRADLAAVLTVALPLIHELDPTGHWRLAKVKERAA